LKEAGDNLEPISHYFYSHRLKLHFWDWGHDDKKKPSLILVHGGLDHARNWDWVAPVLREHFHVFAIDLRGHGNSAWSPGALYTIAEHVLDLSALADIINDFPIYLVGHSLGGIIVLQYSGIFPERVKKVVAIEGLGPPPTHRIFNPASQRLREWIDNVRSAERREAKTYPTLESAVARMMEANPHLKPEVAQSLTLHGTNWNADGSLIWKFDNFARPFAPYGHNIEDAKEILGCIECPVLLFWGKESWALDPETDNRTAPIRNHRLIKVDNAGHWVHHDQLELFLEETLKFLRDEPVPHPT